MSSLWKEIRSLGSSLAGSKPRSWTRARSVDVSQRFEALSRRLVQHRPAFGTGFSNRFDEHPAQAVIENPRLITPLLHEVVGLARVLDQIVHLGPGGPDVLPPIGHHALEGIGIVLRREQALAVERPLPAERLSPVEGSREVSPLQRLRSFDTQYRAHRRHDIHDAHGIVDLPALPWPGKPEDQGDPDRTLVDEVGVVELAVLAEHLPVIAGDDDQGRLVKLEGFQALDDAPDAVVGVGDFTGIEVVLKSRCKGLWRRIGGVGIVVVQEEEEGLALVSLQPLQSETAGLFTPAFTRGRCPDGSFESILVGSKALVESRLRIQHEGAHDRARREASPVEHLGQRFVRVSQLVVEIVADAVTRRDGAGQHRAVSRQRHRNWGIGVREDDALLGDSIDVRGELAGIAVAAEVVGSAGVDADQEDVANPLGGRRAGEEKPARAAGGHQEQEPESRPTSGNGPAPVAFVCHDSQSGISEYSTSIVDPPAGMWSRSNTMELMAGSNCQPVVVRMPST